MNHYLIAPSALSALLDGAVSRSAPSAAEIVAFAAAAPPVEMRTAADVAHIEITGVLTPRPDLLAMLFGGGNTTYEAIQGALKSAAQDPTVKRVVMHIDSPGGTIAGLFETLQAIESFSKPITVVASQATSAAYAIAAAAGPITAATPAASFGSIGVATSLVTNEKIVDLANRESPGKRPDVTTPEGRAVVQDNLDAVFELFVEAIAKGRGVASTDVVQNFGRGRTVLAREAMRAGMIDRIAKTSESDPGSAASATSRLLEKIGAIKSGRLQPNLGESDDAFAHRVAAMHDIDDEHEVHGTPDLGDRIVALLESGRRQEAPSVERSAPRSSVVGEDLGDLVVEAMARNRGARP